jgi:hypothetical protein
MYITNALVSLLVSIYLLVQRIYDFIANISCSVSKTNGMPELE